jgi:ABC-type Fe3+/spermidine/putrescine transport system ATPase subunit
MNVKVRVYVTHDQDEALSMSDRVVIMRQGRIEQQGTPAEVYDDPVSLWAATFVGSSNLIPGTVRSVGGQVVLENRAAALSWRPDAVRIYRPDAAADQEAPLATAEVPIRNKETM